MSTPEDTQRFIEFIQQAEEESPDLGMKYGDRHLKPDDIIREVQTGTDIGIRLLELFLEDERESAQ